MSSINPNQLNTMAQEIANLLDAKESSETTKGDSQIEASIWNKFVGPDENGKNQVGNGEKSKIEKEIPFQKAISSIASYIKNKGTAAIQEALKRVGIDWKPSVDVEANPDVQQKKNGNKLDPKVRAAAKQKLKAMQEQTEKTQKRCEELEKQKNTVTTKVKINGQEKNMTYKEITNQLYSFKQRYALLGVVYDDPNGKPRDPRLSDIHEHLRFTAQKGNAGSKQSLEELESLLAAKHELEKQYPDFKNYRYVGFGQPDGSYKYINVNHTKNQDFIDE